MRNYETMAAAARDALLLQDACNASGVAHTLVDVMHFLRDLSTTERNTHPLVRIIVDKLLDLSGRGDDFGKTYAQVKELANGR